MALSMFKDEHRCKVWDEIRQLDLRAFGKLLMAFPLARIPWRYELAPRSCHEQTMARHVLLYLLTRWLMVEAAEKHGIEALRLGFTDAHRELRNMLEALLKSSPQHVACVLLPRLCKRIAEHVVPLRPGRHYPRPSDGYAKKKYRQAAKTVTCKT
jgi:hypothetical protein